MLQDFAWWSGLTVSDAKAGLESASDDLASETFGGRTWWFAESAVIAAKRTRATGPIVRLLPNYDESVMYREGSPQFRQRLERTVVETVLAAHILTIDGQVAGGWRREMGRGRIAIEVTPLRALNKAERDALRVEADRYERFLAMSVEIRLAPVYGSRRGSHA